jgi:hypothetical protein
MAGPPVAAAATPRAGAQAPTPSAQLVVVAAVADLRWADALSMPVLAGLADSSALGSLADKTVAGSTGCAAGLLAVAAGTRTVAPPGAAPSDCAAATSGPAAAANSADAYAADIHALGDQLGAARIPTFAAGPGAAAMLAAGGSGRPEVTADPATAIRKAATTPGGRAVVGVSDDSLLTGGSRGVAERAVDGWLQGVVTALPPGALLIVAGTSDAAAATAHLHVLLLHGPGIGHVEVQAGAGRPSYVQLIDLAPTVTAALGLGTDTAYDGTAITLSSAPAATVPELIDADRHATADIGAAVAVRTLLIGLAGLALVLFALAARRPRVTQAARMIGRLAAPLLVLSWLAQLVPWWRAGTGWLVAGMLAVAVAACWGMMLLRTRGLPAWVELVAWPAVTALTLAGDQLAGAPLQLSAPLGDNPLQAGRFAGIGNTAFAVLLGSSLLVVAVAAGRLIAAGWRRRALAATAAALGVVVLIDAAPSLGDDLGGALAAVPAAALTFAVLAGWRLRPWRVAGVAVAAVALAALAAVVDHTRPVADQTHLGRFVGQVLHGGAGSVLRRKIDAVLLLQGELPLVLALVACVAPARWRRSLARWVRLTPGLPAAAAGLAVLAVIGSLTNDSGVTVAGFALIAVVPAVVAAAPAPRAVATPC